MTAKRKMTARKKVPQRKIEDILDSDDELPTEYIETPYVPAYQNDNRFIEEQQKQRKELLEMVVAEGLLNKKDIFCFKCLEPTVGHTTLMWFFKYLMLKDLQSNYKFLRSCLVPDYNNYIPRTNFKYKHEISDRLFAISLMCTDRESTR